MQKLGVCYYQLPFFWGFSPAIYQAQYLITKHIVLFAGELRAQDSLPIHSR